MNEQQLKYIQLTLKQRVLQKHCFSPFCEIFNTTSHLYLTLESYKRFRKQVCVSDEVNKKKLKMKLIFLN